MGSILDSVEHHEQFYKGKYVFNDYVAPAQEFIIGKDYVEDVSTAIIYNLGRVTFDEEAVIDGRFVLLRVLGKINLIPNLRDAKIGDYIYFDRQWKDSHHIFWTIDEYREKFLNRSKSREEDDGER